MNTTSFRTIKKYCKPRFPHTEVGGRVRKGQLVVTVSICEHGSEIRGMGLNSVRFRMNLSRILPTLPGLIFILR